MRILVTGGGGFIGSHLCERLLQRGHEVRVVDRAPANLVPGTELQMGELGDSDVAARAVAGVDAVFHLAARVGLGLDFKEAPLYVSDNELATATMLAALAWAQFKGRLVLASSMVVYGEGMYACPDHGVVRPHPRSLADLENALFEMRCPVCAAPVPWVAVRESVPLDPRSVYAATKVAQEHLCSTWARETGGTVAALRYHNVYGRRLPLATPYAGVAALFRDRLGRGEAPLVFEDGGQTRDFVHVTDVAIANTSALSVEIKPGSLEAFNVASGRPMTILGAATALASAFGREAPQPKVTGCFRMGDVRHVVASPDLAADRLGFRASVLPADGFADLAREPISSTVPIR